MEQAVDKAGHVHHNAGTIYIAVPTSRIAFFPTGTKMFARHVKPAQCAHTAAGKGLAVLALHACKVIETWLLLPVNIHIMPQVCSGKPSLQADTCSHTCLGYCRRWDAGKPSTRRSVK